MNKSKNRYNRLYIYEELNLIIFLLYGYFFILLNINRNSIRALLK